MSRLEREYAGAGIVLALQVALGVVAFGGFLVSALVGLRWLVWRTLSLSGGLELTLHVAAVIIFVGSFVNLLWGVTPFGRKRQSSLGDLPKGSLPEIWEILGRLGGKHAILIPNRVVLVKEANACASLHRGLVGVLSNDRKLSLGLPLLYTLNLDEIELVLSHELAHFRDRFGMRLCAISFELEGALNRTTHGFSLIIRRRIVDTQKVTALRVLGLCYLAVCTFPLRLVFDWLAPAIGRGRDRLYQIMELRADRFEGSEESANQPLQRLRQLVGRIDELWEGSLPKVSQKNHSSLSSTCKGIAKKVGRMQNEGVRLGNRLDWRELDKLI